MTPLDAERNISEFLDAELLSRLPSLELRARYLVQGLYSGQHKSPFRGANAEFKEHREYFPGDDPGRIDWKVYARTRRLHLRVNEEDTELSATVLIDASRSMDFRSGASRMTKWDYGCSIAAACMLLMWRQKDFFTFAAAGSEALCPGRHSNTKHHFAEQLEKLRMAAPDSLSCPLEEHLREMADSLRPGSILMVISDFYQEPASLSAALDLLRRKRCETVCIHLLDAAEYRFDYTDPLVLCEGESGARMTVSPALVKKEYQERLQRHIASLTETVKGRGGDYLLCTTDRVPLDALGTYLAARGRIGRRM